jgi:hypothetical protein
MRLHQLKLRQQNLRLLLCQFQHPRPRLRHKTVKI